MAVLPVPPSDEQKYMYLDQKKWPFYIFAGLSSLLLFTGMFTFTWANPQMFVYGLFVTFLMVYLFASYAIGVKGKSFDFKKHQNIVSMSTDKDVSIDIFLPICGEPINIVENTWKYVAELSWPKELLKVHVLDDGWSDAARDMAARFGFNYIRREDRPKLKKAGNIRNAFAQTNGDFIVILDADFAPRHDFLHETIPYLKWDSKIAILQTPQFFVIKKGQSWIEQGANFIQELFYRLIQVSRDTWGASICVGSCAVYRRKALEPMGGTYPIEHSEDLHTGFSMLMAGYKVKYIPINLATGVSPDTMPSFWVQQYRWCTGSTSLLTNRMFWETKLSFMARIAYLTGMCYYVATATGIFLNVIPSMVMVWFYPEKLIWFSCIFYTPSFVFGVFFMKWWTKADGSVLDAMRVRQISYHAHLFALKDRMLKSTMPWIPTGAMTVTSNFLVSRRVMWRWTTISTFTVVAGSAYNMLGWWDYNFYPTLFFAFFNYWISSTVLRDQ